MIEILERFNSRIIEANEKRRNDVDTIKAKIAIAEEEAAEAEKAMEAATEDDNENAFKKANQTKINAESSASFYRKRLDSIGKKEIMEPAEFDQMYKGVNIENQKRISETEKILVEHLTAAMDAMEALQTYYAEARKTLDRAYHASHAVAIEEAKKEKKIYPNYTPFGTPEAVKLYHNLLANTVCQRLTGKKPVPDHTVHSRFF